ncbi:T9SS type B sorting domain-containing protein [Allomuricauda sp. SCSIO 65647]|uniref:T9SS type B sorting domain-containing protein n=1 Tax=Allomuricauda sp. SCSIO 65647 TaxID=2908843 RepID=UPI001F1B9EB6|nr:T9SS type B sorting domain-containing protein [Muricauda sp. SCSIO 65647]UJH66707.1 T9SS type B sorting domain-containing protein [Muricauda sp. SCSIO 65647]
MARFVLLFIILLMGFVGHAQISADCGDAVPICNNTPVNGGTDGYGNDDFDGRTTSGCLEATQTGAIESNSAWYRFRTGASGQLGFNIGHDSTEDWDFALYRASDCNDLGEPIRCNFFDNSDQKNYTGVGVDPSGDSGSVLYEDWLNVNPGEDYYLLINNFSNSNSGFSIQFSGEIFVTNPYDALDCSIVSNLLGPPIAACQGDPVILDATTSGALNYRWYSDTGTGFQLISGETNATLNATADAIYRVEVATSSGTLVSDVQVAYSEIPITGPVTDETICHSEEMVFDLEAKDTEALGVQDPNSFQVSYHASQSDALNGINALTKQYSKLPGSETIYVRTYAIENPNCSDVSQSFELNALETPNLTFDDEVPICENNPLVTIGEMMPNPLYDYEWSTGETTSSIQVSAADSYSVTVTNSANGVDCSSTRTVNVNISETPQISSIEIDDLRANNTVEIVLDNINADYFEFQLNDDPFQDSNIFTSVLPGTHTLTVRDRFGCGELSENIVVVGFSNHFSPNGDGLNENWQIEGLSSLNSPIVTIYDRYGKLLKQLDVNNFEWDGQYNGAPLPATDYWFKLSYIDDSGNRTYAKYIQTHFSLRR